VPKSPTEGEDRALAQMGQVRATIRETKKSTQIFLHLFMLTILLNYNKGGLPNGFLTEYDSICII